LIRQEAALQAIVPQHIIETVARFTRLVRQSPAIDARSGVSARFAVAAAEAIAASALRRSAITGEQPAVARVSDLAGVVPSLRGKVEFEVSEEGREEELLQHLMRRAVAETFRSHLAGVDLSGLVEQINQDTTVVTGELVTAAGLLEDIGTFDGLARIVAAVGDDGAESPAMAAAALEFALEGLYLTRKISKDDLGGTSIYGAV